MNIRLGVTFLDGSIASPTTVMAGRVPAIYDFDLNTIFKSWMQNMVPSKIVVL